MRRLLYNGLPQCDDAGREKTCYNHDGQASKTNHTKEMRTLFKRLATLLLALIFSVAFIIPIGVYAQEENQDPGNTLHVCFPFL